MIIIMDCEKTKNDIDKYFSYSSYKKEISKTDKLLENLIL